jgi:enamine deaminase RidA (YjgF/YER057c/UK114 family)
MVGAVPPDMEAQMRQTYANAKKILATFGAPWMTSSRKSSMSPTWTRLSRPPAQCARKPMGPQDLPWQARFSSRRLALAAQLIEIKFIAKVTE